MNWNTVWLIILATVIVAGVVMAGELISAHAQIAGFSPSRDTNQIATDNGSDNNDNNDNNGGSVGINAILTPTTNMTPPLRTYVMPNGSLALVNTTSGELINVTTTTIPESTLQLTPTPTGEEPEENPDLGSGNRGGGGGQEKGSTEPPQRKQQEPIRDPNELARSREEGSPENRLLSPR